MNPLFDKLWLKGYSETNRNNILSFLKQDKTSRFIDLGCDDGSLTIDAAKKIGTESIYGLEKNPSHLEECSKQGICIVAGDLDNGIPFKNNCFDTILCNQVIEHVCNTDLLLKEINRIYRSFWPRGLW